MKALLSRIGTYAVRSFLLITEPRVQRLLYLAVYVGLVIGGYLLVTIPPEKFQDILGFWLVLAFGLFVMVGGVLCAIAVLPGINWLERAGILSLIVGLFIFMVLVIALRASTISFVFGAVLALLFTIRYLEIRSTALAPKLG